MRLGSTALATERVERRLAAILAADVAGYSRLMGADEEATVARLKALRRDLADPKIKEHRGRIVKTTGDGLLIEFASVVDAVRCAVEVQREMAKRNADVPSDRRIEFRMGINFGDIMKDGRDIYGDGVNLAARLEALAEPGGICVSRVVRDQVRDKLAFSFEDMGACSGGLGLSSSTIRWPRTGRAMFLTCCSLQEKPNSVPSYRFLASCCAKMGRLNEAREAVKQI